MACFLPSKKSLLFLLTLLFIGSFIHKDSYYRQYDQKYRDELSRRTPVQEEIKYIPQSYNSSWSRRPIEVDFSRTLDLRYIKNADTSTIPYPEVMRLIADLLQVSTHYCNKTIVLGGKGYCHAVDKKRVVYDGYKPVCFDEKVRPVAKNCTVLSFGVGDEFSFDDAAALYGCKVYSFDFTLKNWTNKCYGPNKHFMDFGIGPRDVENMIFRTNLNTTIESSTFTLKTVLEFLDLSDTTIDVLKMDIEDTEWQVFAQIFSDRKTAAVLNRVNQIVIEIHLELFHSISSDYDGSIDKLVQVLEMLQNLLKAGYRMVHSMTNLQTESTVVFHGMDVPMYKELHFIRVKHV